MDQNHLEELCYQVSFFFLCVETHSATQFHTLPTQRGSIQKKLHLHLHLPILKVLAGSPSLFSRWKHLFLQPRNVGGRPPTTTWAPACVFQAKWPTLLSPPWANCDHVPPSE